MFYQYLRFFPNSIILCLKCLICYSLVLFLDSIILCISCSFFLFHNILSKCNHSLLTIFIVVFLLLIQNFLWFYYFFQYFCYQEPLHCNCSFTSYYHFLNPHAPGEGEISLPHSRAIFSKLKNEDKDLFSFKNCKKWCKKAQNAIISLSFPSYLNWQPPENRLCIGERARREVAKWGWKPSSGCLWMNTAQYSFAIHWSLIFNDLSHVSAQMKRGKWWYVYKPHPAVN